MQAEKSEETWKVHQHLSYDLSSGPFQQTGNCSSSLVVQKGIHKQGVHRSNRGTREDTVWERRVRLKRGWTYVDVLKGEGKQSES